MAGLTAQALTELIHHVFLPPKLPQQDDTDTTSFSDFTKLSLAALKEFSLASPTHGTILGDAIKLLATSHAIHDLANDNINETGLREALEAGKPAFLHVRAQNAGILITYNDDGNAVFEQFELSAHNEAVMATEGRLIRNFPASAVFVHWNTASDGGFRTTLAHTIAMMCHQTAAQMQPQTQKTGSNNAESRDTTHPGLVSELLEGFLKAAGVPVSVSIIQKRHRDDVLWDNAKNPWRRSPAWLLIKVSLQLTLSRATGGSSALFKQVMAYLMAYMLKHAVTAGLPAEMLYVMNAKIARRLEKIKHDVANPLTAGPIIESIQTEMRTALQELSRQWAAIRSRQPRPMALSSTLSKLHLQRDTLHNLPELDKYLQTLHGRPQISTFDAFTPTSRMVKLDPTSLPSAKANVKDSDYAPASLQQFETWISVKLGGWARANCNRKDACADLRNLLAEYHVVAQDVYAGNPEAMSWMLLTIFEIWVMCDKIAVHSCPLLRKYDHGIPDKALQNLLLPLKVQMERLHAIELYLNQRSNESTFASDKLLNLHSSDGFAVKYFDQSTLHQDILQRIATKAKTDKESKLIEFDNLKAEHVRLMGLYNETKCDEKKVLIEVRDGVPEYEMQHPKACKRHQHFSRAERLQISIFEEPLPEQTIQKKAVVFELQVPSWYSNWRDARSYLLRNILNGKNAGSKPKSATTYALSKDRHLAATHFQKSNSSPRIGLLSEPKPNIVAHYHAKLVGSSTKTDVFKKSGVVYQYYDSEDGSFADDVQFEQKSQLAFVYKLPEPLRRFIFRPADPRDDGPSPNLVIASQSQCPASMTLEEYKELCELPLGYNIQWQNILLRLTSPSVDFKKSETTLMLLQCIYQTGPPDGTSLRQTHTIITSDLFASKLLAALITALDRVKANWESSQALCIFTAIGSRLLSLSPSTEIQSGCLAFLEDARKVAFDWVKLLREKADNATEHAGRTSFTTKAVEIAVICATTLDVDNCHLNRILESPQNASILVQLSIAVQEGGLTSSSDSLFRILRLRLKRLLHRAYTKLVRESDGVDLAIESYLPIYQSGTRCRVSSPSVDYWLVAETSPDSGNDPTKVHYNLLTGELLVNGSALNRPPKSYENTSLYKVLFGRAAVAVMPSTVSGMRFSTKRPEGECAVHLNLTESGDLLVQTSSTTRTYETIPSRLLHDEFPAFFGNDFVHFYESTDSSPDDVVEFRPVGNPWSNDSPDTWQLARLKGSSGWRMTRLGGDDTLISRTSPTSKTISKTLRPVARAEYLHIIVQKSGIAEVEIPSLRLGFSLDHGDGSLRSHQYREMRIDDDQSLDTLIGFGNKLVLRTSSNIEIVRRMVLIPEAPVSYCSDDQSPAHTKVTISRSRVVRVHAFGVDTQLGRLTGSGSLESRLFLAFLHALTTFCLPDGLTGRTGTEQALAELNSAGVRSFDRLTQGNVLLLKQIADLTPGRSWYPANKCVMQQVKWDSRIGFLAQHGGFYATVASIFAQAQRSDKIFYPDLQLRFPQIHRSNTSLLKRESIRSSSFRVSGFGAEDHTVLQDADYNARDCGQTSQRCRNAYLTSSFILRREQELPWAMQGTDYIWHLIKSLPKVIGQPIDLANLKYDATMLSTWKNFVLKHWTGLHEAVKNRQELPQHKFKIMIWLSTIGFAANFDLHVLQILATLFTRDEVARLALPPCKDLNPSAGKEVKTKDLQDVIREHTIGYVETIQRELTDGYRVWNARKEAAVGQHKQKSNIAVARLAAALTAQGCCAIPVKPKMSNAPEIVDFIRVDEAIKAMKPLFKVWYDNSLLHTYLQVVEGTARTYTIREAYVPAAPPANIPDYPIPKGYIMTHCLFDSTEPPDIPTDHQVLELPPRVGNRRRSAHQKSPLLEQLIRKLQNSTGRSKYKQGYVEDLTISLASLRSRDSENSVADQEPLNLPRKDLAAYLKHCERRVDRIFLALESAVKKCSETALLANQFPRVSQMLFLCQLSHGRWSKLKPQWQTAIVEYGLALTALQRAQRILRVFDCKDSSIADLVNELQNTGHSNWSPHDFPESLLIEVEGGIMIRDVQESIASEMRSPRDNRNATMQLNMGQGKSSLIVPIVSCALADRSQLVRVIVAKPQSKQMADMLKSKLGAAVGRRVYYMPFSRSLKLDLSAADTVFEMCQECLDNGGVLLVQPEHVLSFKLMPIECFLIQKEEIGRSLQRTEDLLDLKSRDIADESDENFSVKFELIYTVGTQRTIEGNQDRWSCIQQVLELVRTKAPAVLKKLGSSSIEIHDCAPGAFPRIRVLKPDAERLLLEQIAREICDGGLDGFPLGRQTKTVQDDIYAYMIQPNPTPAVIKAVETGRSAAFWSDSTKSTILLLRGLLGGGVLAFTFGQKRWRVNFGLATRTPLTQLSVPFRAKDCPSPRSEFSHPDVVIALTSLCYYYGGLDDEDMFTALGHLIESDQEDMEYQAWVTDANRLEKKFSQLGAINLEDRQQCTSQVFPALKSGKSVVDYFLSHVVFPKEMKEFPQKLSASGWDIGKCKAKPTTGFSGTNDSRIVLPLDMRHLDLEQQNHTNATHLEDLLQPENTVELIPSLSESSMSDAESILSVTMELSQSPEVILDVGAQILELDNLQVAQKWLEMRAIVDSTKEAAVFFNLDDELSVVDRKGRVELLKTSSFASRLGSCLVFLDEAHTRGTDLVLPTGYRAAVTLGAHLTKDRLVQACMRMRKLGHGQSVVFLISEEIQTKIHECASKSGNDPINVSDVLLWAISETWAEIHRSMPLWAVQGERYVQQEELWKQYSTDGKTILSQKAAETFLADEAQSIEQRYRPRTEHAILPQGVTSSTNPKLQQILERCQQFPGLKYNSSALQEEQERELSPEIEQERQIQRAAPAKPEKHVLSAHVRKFALQGLLVRGSQAYFPAFEALRETSGAQSFDLTSLASNLWVTADFARTVAGKKGSSYRSDQYQRSAQWIVSSCANDNTINFLMIISPAEADWLAPEIALSTNTALHLYKARCNSGYPTLDELDLYTVTAQQPEPILPRMLAVQLGLFAGQLYLSSFKDYHRVCRFLHLTVGATPQGWVVTPDGFVISNGTVSRGKHENPVQFIKFLMSTVRRNGQGIAKTHMGGLLEGRLLKASEFEKLQ